MKRNKVVLVLFYVLASAVIVGALALTVYEFAVTREGTASTAIRAGVIVVGMGAAIYRVATLSGGGGARQNIATYRASYGEFIGNAFEGDFRREKLFFSAVGDYQVDSFRSAIRKLERLRPSCKRPNEIFAVRFFIALCYDDMGAYPLAIANYESILTTRKNSRVLSNLGMCYQHIGDDAAGGYGCTPRIHPEASRNEFAVISAGFCLMI